MHGAPRQPGVRSGGVMRRLMRVGCLAAFALSAFAASAAPRWGVGKDDFARLDPNALLQKANSAARMGELEAAARQDDLDAQVLVGIAKLYGIGTPRDDAAARTLLRAAAERRHARAMAGWAVLLFNGLAGVPQDAEAARASAQRSADAGNFIGMLNLAFMLASGNPAPEQMRAAVGWYARAAEGGVAAAQTQYGIALANGVGVARDAPAAARWFRRAADAGDVGAMFELGALLQRAGYAMPVADAERLTVTYATPLHLMRELRAIEAKAAKSSVRG